MERQILLGLITSTEYLHLVKDIWKNEYLETEPAKKISQWCWDYYNKKDRAPKSNVQTIFIRRTKKAKISKDLVEDIELLLQELSKEAEVIELDVQGLFDETKKYFNERKITLYAESLLTAIEKDEVEEAEKLIDDFTSLDVEEDDDIIGEKEIVDSFDEAFNTEYQNVISFPGALGKFWNDELVRGGLVAFLAPEKRGKTFWLLEFMLRAYRQGKTIMFFQAGDMTRNQQLVRLAIYLAKKSNKEKFTGKFHTPLKDCIRNQTNNCRRPEREYRGTEEGVFYESQIKEGLTKQELVDAYIQHPRHKTCFNCAEYEHRNWGAVWLKEEEVKSRLRLREARRVAKKFIKKSRGRFKLATYANGTLSVEKMKGVLKKLERQEGFKPDLILVDYADLLISDRYKDERHNVNDVWKKLRGLSQSQNALVITPTQADADSYERDTLSLKNFSEDKRKYAHVTAMYGMNQDKEGKEKSIGIMRFNKLVAREDEFHSSQQVSVLYNFRIGRPFLDSINK